MLIASRSGPYIRGTLSPSCTLGPKRCACMPALYPPHFFVQIYIYAEFVDDTHVHKNPTQTFTSTNPMYVMLYVMLLFILLNNSLNTIIP